MSYLKDFNTSIANRNYPHILQLWEEYCGGDELDTEELCAILRAIKSSEFAEPFGREVERILPLWSLLEKGDASHEVLKLIVDLSTSNSPSLEALVQEHLTARYGHEKNFADKLRMIGFRNKEKVQGIISSYELLSHLAKGNYVFHSGGWGVGEILDMSAVREQITLEFDGVSGKKELSFATAFKVLTPLPSTHFLARRFGAADALEKLANQDPLAVIHMLLKDLGPKTAADIKEELCDLVIPEEQWQKWWQTTRSKLKKDTLIELPATLKEPFALRKQGLSHEDRVKTSLDLPHDTQALIQMLYSNLKDFPEIAKNEELKQIAIAKIKEALSDEKTTPPHHLELLFLLQEFYPSKDNSQIASFIEHVSSIENLIEQIEIQALKKRTLMEVKKQRADWKSLFMDLLLKVDSGSLKDYILSELLAANLDDELKEKFKALYLHPGKHPEAFLWYFQKLGQTQHPIPFNDKEGKIRFFEGLLILLSAIEHKSETKHLVKKIYSLITDGRFALTRAIMQMASLEEVKEILLLASKCHSLPEHDQKIFQSLAEVVYPTLGKSSKKRDAAESDHTIWTTQEGYDKVKKKIEQIATVEVVANSQEIEAARAHGDLRENAEFKAALEKRDRLQSEIKLLSDQLKNARIITAHDVSKTEVSPGTVIECSNKQGNKVTYTLLGPWDANPDKNILSFQSKLAQAMKGKTVGATLSIPGDELTIVSIRSIFEDQ